MGVWAVVEVYYRPDRAMRPRTALRIEPLKPIFGWCDAPGDRNYNRRVTLPYPASAERLWRDDAVYDLVAVLDYNRSQRTQGRGSAIFLHVARAGFPPTEGCIALKREHLLRLLATLKPGAAIATGTPPRSISAAASGSGTGRLPAFQGRALWRRSSRRA